jgi:hypothetical protein
LHIADTALTSELSEGARIVHPDRTKLVLAVTNSLQDGTVIEIHCRHSSYNLSMQSHTSALFLGMRGNCEDEELKSVISRELRVIVVSSEVLITLRQHVL